MSTMRIGGKRFGAGDFILGEVGQSGGGEDGPDRCDRARGGGVYAKMSFTCVTEGPPIYKLPYKPVHTPCLFTFLVQIAKEKQT